MKFTALTPDQRRQFDTQGFLIVRNAIDADTVEALVDAGDRLVATDRTEYRQRSADGLFDGFRNCITLDPAFEPLLTCPTTVPLIVQLFGPHIHLVTSHLIYKGPDSPDVPDSHRDPGWHRDIAGTPEDLGHANIPRMEMKCAYYLTDLSAPASGATLMAAGSNHAKSAIAIDPSTGDPESVVEPLLKAGDAVFFENRTYHAGGLNRSGRTRKAVMFGYGYQWMAPFDYREHPTTWTNRFDPIGRQLLGALKDAEGRFISGGIDYPLRDWCRENGVVYTPPAPTFPLRGPLPAAGGPLPR